LYPGEVFAEAALGGIRTRLSTVQAVTACDLAVIEYKDFMEAKQESGSQQKESVDDRFQFLQKSTLLRHWDGIDVYKLASVLVHEEVPKGQVLIRKGEMSNKLCFLKEGKIDVVVGLGVTQQQHIITTMKPYEIFLESGILNNFVSGAERTEKITEACYAIAGSHCVILSLSETHYSMMDQITMDRILVGFREKAIWRVSRLHNLKAESRNVKKLKQKMLLDSANERIKEECVPPIKLNREASSSEDILNDIPKILNGGIDPLLAMSKCKNNREVRKVQQVIKDSQRPKSATAGLAVHNDTTSINTTLNYRRQATSPLPDVKPVYLNQVNKMQQTATNVNSSKLLPEMDESNNAFWSRTPEEYLKKPSNMLVGSTRIPFPESYGKFIERVDVDNTTRRATSASGIRKKY
jgi:CRP-like cAMP-binding protein